MQSLRPQDVQHTAGYTSARLIAAYIPQAFDGARLLWIFLTRPEIVDCIECVRREVASWPNVSTSLHRFGGVEFQVDGSEIGHIHGNGLVDVRLSVELRTQVVADKIAQLHHTLPDTGCACLPLRSQIDSEAAIGLLRMSYTMYAGIRCTPDLERSEVDEL